VDKYWTRMGLWRIYRTNVTKSEESNLLASLLAMCGSASTTCRTKPERRWSAGCWRIKTLFGCELWARTMHRPPFTSRDLRLCPSCKYFHKPTDATPRCFVIDSAGISDTVERRSSVVALKAQSGCWQVF
jgi:hypothetical protein